MGLMAKSFIEFRIYRVDRKWFCRYRYFTSGETNKILPILTIISEEEEAGGGQSRLFVGGLPQGVSTEQVRGLFKQYGDVKDVYIPAG